METKPIVKVIRFFMILFASFIALSFVLISCGGGGDGGGGASTGTVATSITDPPTCKSPTGPFDEVWVTITRVRAHTSSDAGSNDSGWVDLVDLRSNPRQLNLFDLTSTVCLLTQLGSTSGIPVGKYQQIRVYLLSNSPTGNEVVPRNNQCGEDGYNCVVIDGVPSTLLLSSQANTGIKIPPGQISGGGLTVAANQTVDLNIDFDACSSIVQLGNGQYRLKPTLRAAEVSVNTKAISGRIIDIDTKLPVANATVMLEVKDPSGIDRPNAQKLTGEDGGFIFCPLPEGITSFDIVAAAPVYNTTITLQVPVGQALDIPLYKDPGGSGSIAGNVSTAPDPANVKISALQAVPASGGSFLVTIPLFTGSISNVVTQSGGACPAGTNCADYNLIVPASNPYAGTFSASLAYTKLAANVYEVEARAYPLPTDGSIPFCSNDILTKSGIQPNSTGVNFVFTGCSP